MEFIYRWKNKYKKKEKITRPAVNWDSNCEFNAKNKIYL